ncbi:MAG: cell division protein [Streptococcaceae bacterium]|jgi:RNA-binding protein YlmH|nr:cell division protein [Streptococcaceae bacterium]
MRQAIYQHFRASEKTFIDKASDWLSRVSDHYGLVTTDFLNPRQLAILKTLVNGYREDQVQMFVSSSLVQSEYVKVILAPRYYELDVTDFDLACLQIDFASKFVTLKHSQILGTLLGETGLDRSKIGDIVAHQTFAQVLVNAKLVPLMIASIDKIAGSGVKLREIGLAEFVKPPEQTVDKILTMSSLRLDKAIASAFNISRSQVQNLIQSRQAKVNYSDVLRNDFELDQGDLISVRGLGRFKIVQELGLTKKDKLRVEVQLISIKQR